MLKPSDFLTIHQPDSKHDQQIAILYFHGGGLLYGTREDLPPSILNQFLNHGLTVISIDYPLAPETKLPEIIANIKETVKSIQTKILPSLSIHHYFLYGRSAGSYLCFILGRDFKETAPLGILAFYGYYNLIDVFNWQTSSYYASLPIIKEESISKMIGKDMVMSALKESRYALYVYARQQGKWLDLLGIDEKLAAQYSLTDEDLKNLPPLFLAASTDDQDVPYRVSKHLYRLKPGTVMKTVYNMEHDFDRDGALATVKEIYDEALNWIISLI